MNRWCENVDPQRELSDGMDEEYERAVYAGKIPWKHLHKDWWPDHPRYKAQVCHLWQKHRCGHGETCFFAHTHPQHPDTLERAAHWKKMQARALKKK